MTRIVALLLAGAVMAAHAAGQERERPPWEDRGRGEPREVVETVRMAKLANLLGLDDEEIVKLVRRYHAMRDKQRSLGRAHAEATNELRELLRNDVDSGEIEAKLDEVREKEAELLQFRWSGFDEIAETLDPEQQAKLYVFAQDFEADMRRLVERARSMRGDSRREWPGDHGGEGRWPPPPRDEDGPRRGGPRMSPEEWESRVREWREMELEERREWLEQRRQERIENSGGSARNGEDGDSAESDSPRDGANREERQQPE